MRCNSFVDRVREAFDYNPEDGHLVWRVGDRTGKVAGCVMKDGYRAVRLDRRMHYAHRLVWILHTGSEPAAHIDHRDGDRLNNRIENLREATRAQNAQNVRAFRNNKSGYLGVSIVGSRYVAQIQVDGRHYRLGYRDNPADAHALYVAAKARLHAFQPVPRESANG